jgi:hypothetical protein
VSGVLRGAEAGHVLGREGVVAVLVGSPKGPILFHYCVQRTCTPFRLLEDLSHAPRLPPLQRVPSAWVGVRYFAAISRNQAMARCTAGATIAW